MATTVRDVRNDAFLGSRGAGAQLGTLKPIAVNVSGGDQVVTQDIRLISACGGTTVCVDMLCVDGSITSVKLPITGGWIPVMNVVNIKQTGTDATDAYLWPFESTSSAH
jgi:hypothetical protein